jgi:hypothetical protein
MTNQRHLINMPRMTQYQNINFLLDEQWTGNFKFCERGLINLRQAKVGQIWDSQKKILHLRLTMLWLRNHSHLAGTTPMPLPIRSLLGGNLNHLHLVWNCPCPFPLIDYWMRITWLPLSTRYHKF